MENDSRKIIKRLKADGWIHVRTKGSHHHFKHPDLSKIITVKHPDKDLTPGLVLSIYKIAGWS
jgi:predicted RNA binding protein YcfA (HicA-like mRNA interferase family)